MSIVTINTPETTVEVATLTNKSRWNGAHEPIVYKLQRQDKPIWFIFGDGLSGEVTVWFANTPPFPPAPNIGDQMYINAGPVEGVFTVSSVNLPNIIRVHSNIVVNAYTGFANFLYDPFLQNYRLETNIMLSVGNVWTKIGSSINKPATDGFIDLDVSAWLKTQVTQRNDFDYDVINEKDLNFGQKYALQFRILTSAFEELFGLVANDSIFFFANPERQIQAKHGNNLGEFVPFPDPTLAEENRAKFLSDFEKPTYFRGYPFDLSFIYSEKIKSHQIRRNEQKFNLNQGLVGGVEVDNLNHSEHSHVNRLMVKDDYDDAKEVDVWLSYDQEVLEAPDDYVKPGYVKPGYTAPEPPPVAQPIPVPGGG